MKEMLNANIWRTVKSKFYWLFTIGSGFIVPVALAIFYIVKENENKALKFYQTVSGIQVFYVFIYSFYFIFGILKPYINSKCVNATVARGISRTTLFLGLIIEETLYLAFWGVTSCIGAIIGALLVGGRGFQTIHMISVFFSFLPTIIFCMVLVNLIMLIFDNAIIGLVMFCFVSIGPIELLFRTIPALSQNSISYYMPITVVDKFWSSLLVFHYFDGIKLMLGILYFFLISGISLYFFKKKELDF